MSSFRWLSLKWVTNKKNLWYSTGTKIKKIGGHWYTCLSLCQSPVLRWRPGLEEAARAHDHGSRFGPSPLAETCRAATKFPPSEILFLSTMSYSELRIKSVPFPIQWLSKAIFPNEEAETRDGCCILIDSLKQNLRPFWLQFLSKRVSSSNIVYTPPIIRYHVYFVVFLPHVKYSVRSFYHETEKCVKVAGINFSNLCVMRPLCLVESQTLDAA